MPAHNYILAFDLGTTANKAVLLNIDTSFVVDSASSPYATYYTHDGDAEQSPDQWWKSTIDICRELSQRSPEAWDNIVAIGCTGTMNGVVLVDNDGNALRNAIIHADSRSRQQALDYANLFGDNSIVTITGNRPDCRLSLPKIMWLQQHEPDILRSAQWVIQSKDYLTGRLTGTVGYTDPSDASLTGAFNVQTRQWDNNIWTSVGLPAHLLPEINPSSHVIGHISLQTASLLNLKAGIPVVTGGGDGACATAGSGVLPGEAYHYLGGSSWIGLVSSDMISDNRLGHYCCLDQYLTVYGTVQSAGSSIEWIKSIIADRSQSSLVLDNLAESVPAGSGNLFFLPYLQGERAPLWDPQARGVFFGLSLSHGKAEIYRSVLEGVAYALRSILDVYAENGHSLPELRQLGGGAVSILWRSILASAYNRKLRIVQGVSEATSLGAAMVAGVGIGVYESFADASIKLTSISEEVAPDPNMAIDYNRRYAFYKSLYPVIKNRFEELGEYA